LEVVVLVRLCGFVQIVLLLACWLAPAEAGTTGGLRGRITDSVTKAPIAGAAVTVTSPSQSATVKTGPDGNFNFISLSPDTYTVSVEEQGYDAISITGVNVQSDQVQNIGGLPIVKSLQQIGTVRTRSTSDLVRPGTTSDVYSINAAGQTAAQAVGGPGGINTAYSAIATVPGVNLPQGQQGWNQLVYIRGGDYSDVANELDGIPVQRASDFAPITTLSSLGQQEVQTYTGGTPPSAEASGLSGYINQVIKTGTFPGYGNLEIGLGGPAFYHKLQFELSGATPDHNFTYYLGFAGDNEDYRYSDQFNGAGNGNFFYPLSIGAPLNGTVYDGSSPFYYSPGQNYAIASTQDRENVVNLHFGLPHAGGVGKDDIQLLYVTSEVWAQFYSSVNDLGGANFVDNALGFTPSYPDIYVYNGPLYQSPNANSVGISLSPSSPQSRPFLGPIDPNNRDGNDNGVSIEKLQYQKNFNERSYLRVFGYGEYSNWFINGPTSANTAYGGEILDYEVHGNTFGATAVYSNQLNDRNLLTMTGSYQTQKLETYSNGFNQGTIDTDLVDKKGNCYNPSTGGYASCFTPIYNDDGTINASGGLNIYSQYGTTVPGFPGMSLTQPITAPAGSPAIANGAQWLVTENGQNAQIDQVTPFFSAASIADQWRPNDKTTINLGVRFENFTYRLDNTTNSPARAFWFNAYNREYCFPSGATATEFAGVDPTTGASLCAPGTNTQLSNVSPNTTSATALEPRIGATYSVDPYTVLRASYGRYAAPVPTSYQQYDTVQQDSASFIAQFVPYGFNSPYHPSSPSYSNNYDFSLEHSFKNTDYAVKITPFYRGTQNQLANIPIGAQGVLDGLNVGRQQNYGLEFQFKKGDFGRDGLAYTISYTHTKSRVTYGAFNNGQNEIDLLNQYIKNYNAYTSKCATNPTNGLCGSTSNGQPAAACYTPYDGTSGGIADPTCAAGDIANPYYNAKPQPLMDPNAGYTPYDILPTAFQGANGYETPDVATIVVNYKKGPFSITPSATYSSGAVYGSPLQWPGYDPTTCGAEGSSGLAANPQTCSGFILAPDVYTGKFDTFGAFKEPQRLTVNLQLAYETSPTTRLTLVMTGLLDQCYQRGYAWDNPSTCVYAQLPSNALAPVGNFVPLSQAPQQLAYPYSSWYNNSQTGFVGQKLPFQAFLTFDVKI
jgi:hypothetical protein